MSAGGGGGSGGGGGGDDLGADVSIRMMENYLLLKAAIEQQNQGGFDAMCMHLNTVHRNLVSMIAAVESADVSPDDERRAAAAVAADPRGPEAAAAAAAADAALRALQAISAASVGAAGTAALASLQHGTAAAAAAGGGGAAAAAGGGGAKAEGAPGTSSAKRRKQQEKQCAAAAAAPPPPPPRPPAQGPAAWLGDVGQSAAPLLARLGLAQHQPLLDAAGCDVAALRLMGEGHLLALGLPLGAVVKLRAALGGDVGAAGGGGGG